MGLGEGIAREFFPIASTELYLNHAAVAPISSRVRDAVCAHVTDLASSGMKNIGQWVKGERETRSLAAKLIGATIEEIAFVRSTSHGLGMVAEGLPFVAGDEVAVCTSEEYPANVYPWMHLADKGVQMRSIASQEGGVVLEEVAKVVGEKTRLVSVSAVQFATGVKTDLPALGDFCRQRGIIFCVDGIQQVGAFPLDVEEAKIDILAADSHKWMLGPSGIGFLYVRKSLLPRLRPVIVGWKSVKNPLDFDHLHLDLRDDAAKLEEGSPSFAYTLGLREALGLLLGVGVPSIGEHIAAWLREAEKELRRRGLDPSPAAHHRAGILTFRPPAGTAEEFAAMALGKNLHLSPRRGRVRISPHLYSGEAELAGLLGAL